MLTDCKSARTTNPHYPYYPCSSLFLWLLCEDAVKEIRKAALLTASFCLYGVLVPQTQEMSLNQIPPVNQQVIRSIN